MPELETCDAGDDDCDGVTDEDTERACYAGPAGTAGVGRCRAGVEACDGGLYTGVCADEIQPEVERCEGTDEDCDGLTDEGFDLDAACTRGVGACLRDGVRVCDGEGGAVCNAVAGQPGVEICNRLDDDCDGATDEGPVCLQQVSAGGENTCALLSGGRVKCWGGGYYGVLGQGDRLGRGDGAGEMGANLPAIDFGAARTAVSISAGDQHTCAVLDNGSIKCWGYGAHGQTGLGEASWRGDTPNEMGDSLPIVDLGPGRTARAVSGGANHTCALLDDHTVKCWGDNSYGQCGLGDVRTRGDNVNEMGDNLPAVNLGAGRTARALDVGRSSACALLDTNAVKCWGRNSAGELGLGDVAHRGDGPNEMGDNLPALSLGAGRTALSISEGSLHACAVLDNGTAKCWGHGGEGRLGLGDANNRGDQPNEMGDNLPPVMLD